MYLKHKPRNKQMRKRIIAMENMGMVASGEGASGGMGTMGDKGLRSTDL